MKLENQLLEFAWEKSEIEDKVAELNEKLAKQLANTKKLASDYVKENKKVKELE